MLGFNAMYKHQRHFSTHAGLRSVPSVRTSRSPLLAPPSLSSRVRSSVLLRYRKPSGDRPSTAEDVPPSSKEDGPEAPSPDHPSDPPASPATPADPFRDLGFTRNLGDSTFFEFDSEANQAFGRLAKTCDTSSQFYYRFAATDLLLAVATIAVGKADIISLTNRAASALNNFSMGLLIWHTGKHFRSIVESEGNDLLHLMQGIRVLVETFTHFSVIIMALGITQIAQAAARWPGISIVIVALSSIYALTRIALIAQEEAASSPLLHRIRRWVVRVPGLAAVLQQRSGAASAAGGAQGNESTDLSAGGSMDSIPGRNRDRTVKMLLKSLPPVAAPERPTRPHVAPLSDRVKNAATMMSMDSGILQRTEFIPTAQEGGTATRARSADAEFGRWKAFGLEVDLAFSQEQDREFLRLVQHLKDAREAYLLDVIGKIMLISACVVTGRHMEALLLLAHAWKAYKMASILGRARLSFEDILLTTGRDVSHLLRGLGANQGITQVLSGIGKLARSLSQFQFIEATVLLAVAAITYTGVLGIDKAYWIEFFKTHMLEFKVIKQLVGFLQNGL